MVEGGGPSEGGFKGGADGRRSHVAGGGADPQGENGIPWYRPREGGVEGSGGYSKLLAHSLHHIPRLPPCLPGRSLIRHLHPRGQTAPAVSGHEGGGPVRDIYGPEKCVRHLGNGHMPVNPGGIRRGASIPPHPTGILVQVADVSARRGILQDRVTGIPGGDVGGPYYPTILNMLVDEVVRH